MVKKALITGITGQDGSYLAELLLSKNYEVHGVVRRASSINTSRIDHIFEPEDSSRIHFGQLENGIDNLLYSIKPDEVYSIGSMSHVKVSFDIPIYTADVTGVAPLRILEGIKNGIKSDILSPDIKFYQASSSEMFGITPPPQSETTLMLPVSPYGCAKLFAYHATRAYRFGYKMFACNGILFNHESERRGETFVTRKVTRAIARIKYGLQDKLILGNLEAKRDWGHSKDYMEAIHMIMQHNEPDDFVVSTGETYTVRQFVEEAFNYVGLDPYKYLVIEDRCRRPNEVPALLGDSSKIRKVLGWKPKILFKELVKLMIDNDVKILGEELRGKGKII